MKSMYFPTIIFFNLNEEIAPGVTIRSAAMETLGLSELKTTIRI